MKLAEALVLRKHLVMKVDQLKPLKANGENGLFELQTQRKSVTENVDEVTFQIPKVTLADVTAEYDKYSKALREIDTAIQKANWECDVDFTPKDLNI